MYTDPDYKDKDPKAIEKFIAEYPFAVLSGCDASYKPVATQVPVYLEKRDDNWFLKGHLIKGSDHHRAFEENPRVMLVFPGPHTYVSATWYSDPQQASTWNYMSVQTSGKIRFTDSKDLEAVMQRLTLHFEGDNAASPTVFNNLPADYTERLLQYIVSFEVAVEHMGHIFKLSQNKDLNSFTNIIEHLKKGDANAQDIAREMEGRKHKLFGLNQE